MAMGRCSGCGLVGSCKKVEIHVLTCPSYLTLFRTEPERCLDPASEQQRYKTHEDTSQARAARRDTRLRHRFAEMDRHQSMQAQRWRTPKDILEE